jgi:hypothetical protein
VGNQVSEPSREQLWYWLADAFADVNYAYDKLLNEDLNLLKEIFFNEVVIHCGPAMLTVTPPYGEGFDKDEVINDLKLRLSNRKELFFSRLWQNGLIVFTNGCIRPTGKE